MPSQWFNTSRRRRVSTLLSPGMLRRRRGAEFGGSGAFLVSAINGRKGVSGEVFIGTSKRTCSAARNV
jgi:hypothetical protein